ncbi:ATP-binding protein [Streptomyces sp. NPDC006733]|uniref:ATP-binding protein n=1 Tax=Streptomyces sp. NPDC006733 TaxID=3155460 RepID=UPI0033F4C5D4
MGFGGQYGLAARVVLAKLPTLEWIRVADPEAGVADDFQFKSGLRRHALQVKWSQPAGSFTWADLTSGEGEKPGLLTQLAAAWVRLRTASPEPLTVHLCTNNHASKTQAKGASPIARARTTGPRSLATFVARSFDPVRLEIARGTAQWEDLAILPEVVDWAPVWEALRTLVKLTDDDFVAFVGDLELRFGLVLGDPLLRPDHEPVDGEVAHLAHTLEEIVRDPAQPVELSRDQLMERLGWQDRLRYRHPHQFPVPTVYTTNEVARQALEGRLQHLSGGYLALVGPAGSGKSTLLASLKIQGHVARYYAFVPDAPDPLSSRGEADSFLHDVSLDLQESGLYRRGIGNDLRTQRLVLSDQLDQAGQRWRTRGERTIVVVDGLDHIPREQNPTRSLLEELPNPAALPDGVFIILGTQTTSILPSMVRTALEQEDRIALLPPLAAEEIEYLTKAAGHGSWLYSGQMMKVVDASEGHPLALTYLLQELSALEASEPDEGVRRQLANGLLADASGYGGDVAARYRGYFQAVQEDQQVLDLLGMVARLRVPVNLQWLSTWADQRAVSAFADEAATFFHTAGDDWRFIHHSFRRFLADATAHVAGMAEEARERGFHRQLADVCASSGPEWSLYQDEAAAHLFLAGQYDRVLALAAPQKLRQSLIDLRPLATVRDHALLALRSASLLDDSQAFVHTLVFLSELRLREMVLEREPLAEAVHTFDSRLALDHIARGGRLRITRKAALAHAVTFANRGNVDAVQRILHACGGLAGIAGEEDPSPEAVADWAEATCNLSGLDAVLAALDHQLPHPPDNADELALSTERPEEPAGVEEAESSRRALLRDQQEREASTISCRSFAHARCFDLLVETRDEVALDALTAVIDAEATPSWRARARYMRAQAASEDQAQTDLLRWVREIIAINAEEGDADEADDEELPANGSAPAVHLSIRIAAAELLVRNAFNSAPEIDELVPPGTAVAWPTTVSGQEGLEPFRTLIGLNRLRYVHPDSTQPDPMPTSDWTSREAGNERFRRALRVLAQLEGQRLAASAGLGDPPDVPAQADPIIRLLEVPSEDTRDWTGWYIVRDAALGLFGRVVDLAAKQHGSAGLQRLLSRFDTAWASEDRAGYWAPQRQQAVIEAALKAHADATSWAVEQLQRLDALIDDWSSDPHDRVSLWLAQARVWALAGDEQAARHATRCAVDTSLGIDASDHDRQLVEWFDWLVTAADEGDMSPTQFTATVLTYASRISAADAGHHASGAAEKLIASTFPRDPSLACDLAEWLCAVGTLAETDAVQAVVLAACHHPDIPVPDSTAVAVHLLFPITPEPTEEIAKAVHARRTESSGGDAVSALERAQQLWAGEELNRDAAEQTVGREAIEEASADTADAPPPVQTLGSLLTVLRTAPTAATSPPEGWDLAVEHATATITSTTPAQARALLEQAGRLRLSGSALGRLAALAAQSGESGAAADALKDALSRTPASGWLRHYDGGTRLAVLHTALRYRHPALVQLARQDLANAFLTGSLSAQLSPDDIRDITQLVTEPGTVARAWPDVEAYLDEVAPAATDATDIPAAPAAAISAVEALARWVGLYLGHPVRSLDFGARRALQLLGTRHQHVIQTILAANISRGGWACEAALLTLITTPNDERADHVSAELVAALEAAATGADGISRDVARRFARQHGIELEIPPRRARPAAYGLALPALPERTVPEEDRHGTPHLDAHNPRHMLGPFDLALQMLSEASGLEDSAVLHRAAQIARSNADRWTAGGHHALAQRLTSRHQRHSYRPWAYMAGRRALGTVLGELLDSDTLGDAPALPAYSFGLIDEQMVTVGPQPLPRWMPPIWRPEGTSSYDVDNWCAEAGPAVDEYARAYAAARPYVLAERGQWCSLEWGRPEEERRVHTTHGNALGAAFYLPKRRAWEAFHAEFARYPAGRSLDWADKELVVHGYEDWTDAQHRDWLALHPAVGAELGWKHDPCELFTWRGEDGHWRARTVLLVRGNLSHQPPRHATCTVTWQVQLSETGYAELNTAFPKLKRTLTTTRTLPASRRKRRREETETSRKELAADVI